MKRTSALCLVACMILPAALLVDGCGQRSAVNDGTAHWAAVSVGTRHTVALKNDGTLWGSGTNNDGQLGVGASVNCLITAHPTPTQVGGASDWAAVSCGGDHTLALKKNGTLWAWGSNEGGQLGLGTSDDGLVAHPTPTQVGGASDWAAVSCGDNNYTVALKKDGSLWAWGSKAYGQLGLGHTNNKKTPTEVGSAHNWAAVSCGIGHTLALKKNGTLWAWGRGDWGQLGLGYDNSNRNTPTQVGSAHDWTAVSCGGLHTLAIKKNGTLWAWGRNKSGELGLGDTDLRLTPTQVGSAGDWVAVSCGVANTMALKKNGTIWVWGDDHCGQSSPAPPTRQRIPPRPRLEAPATGWPSPVALSLSTP